MISVNPFWNTTSDGRSHYLDRLNCRHSARSDSSGKMYKVVFENNVVSDIMIFFFTSQIYIKNRKSELRKILDLMATFMLEN